MPIIKLDHHHWRLKCLYVLCQISFLGLSALLYIFYFNDYTINYNFSRSSLFLLSRLLKILLFLSQRWRNSGVCHTHEYICLSSWKRQLIKHLHFTLKSLTLNKHHSCSFLLKDVLDLDWQIIVAMKRPCFHSQSDKNQVIYVVFRLNKL